MERSLSILLPVRDDQSTLATTVHRLLDVLADLPGQFELIVIDDGSTDATIEVADELAVRYPQVSAVRHARPMGREAAIRSGLGRASGTVVLAHDASGLRRVDRREVLSRRSDAAETPIRADAPQSPFQRPRHRTYSSRMGKFAFEE